MITWHNLPDILGGIGMLLGGGEIIYIFFRWNKCNHCWRR
jgi:hypothetical protein